MLSPLHVASISCHPDAATAPAGGTSTCLHSGWPQARGSPATPTLSRERCCQPPLLLGLVTHTKLTHICSCPTPLPFCQNTNLRPMPPSTECQHPQFRPPQDPHPLTPSPLSQSFSGSSSVAALKHAKPPRLERRPAPEFSLACSIPWSRALLHHRQTRKKAASYLLLISCLLIAQPAPRGFHLMPP